MQCKPTGERCRHLQRIAVRRQQSVLCGHLQHHLQLQHAVRYERIGPVELRRERIVRWLHLTTRADMFHGFADSFNFAFFEHLFPSLCSLPMPFAYAREWNSHRRVASRFNARNNCDIRVRRMLHDAGLEQDDVRAAGAKSAVRVERHDTDLRS